MGGLEWVPALGAISLYAAIGYDLASRSGAAAGDRDAGPAVTAAAQVMVLLLWPLLVVGFAIDRQLSKGEDS